VVVAHPDELGNVVGHAFDPVHHLGLELHRPRLTVDVWGLDVPYEPVRAPIEPDVQLERLHQAGDLRHQVLREDVLFQHLHVWFDQEPPVEGRDRRRQGEWLDEHLHAARRTTAGDGEVHAGVAEAAYRLEGALREDLVLRDERAVDVREEQPDRGWGLDGPIVPSVVGRLTTSDRA
jgi:hypothetical protein